MRMYDIILKKREGMELIKQEIDFFVKGYTSGAIPDYQASALLMAIFLRGLNDRETADLTMAICDSGERIDLSAIPGIKVDKHSTGGVGDKTTLVLVPLVAAAGVPVVKMSGRGLGHTGGTVDKLESIPGYQVALEPGEFIAQVHRVGAAVVAQTGQLAPADKKLYALRDVTATVDSIPLIASSVMSKKIAAGADAIVLDVKVGSGAFMRQVENGFELARAMVEIGNRVGRHTVAVISGMDQPLGNAIGNALEVKEAVQTLKGQGPEDLVEICLTLGAVMLLLVGKVDSFSEGRTKLTGLLQSGKALNKFIELIAAQGGDPGFIKDESILPTAGLQEQVFAPRSGYVESIQAETVGRAAMILGAGRERKEDKIDLSVGILLNKKVGEHVEEGEALAVIHGNHQERISECKTLIQNAYIVGERKMLPLIYGTVPEGILS